LLFHIHYVTLILDYIQQVIRQYLVSLLESLTLDGSGRLRRREENVRAEIPPSGRESGPLVEKNDEPLLSNLFKQ